MASGSDNWYLFCPHDPTEIKGWGSKSPQWHHIARRGEMLAGDEKSANLSDFRDLIAKYTAGASQAFEASAYDKNEAFKPVQPFTYFIHPSYDDPKANLAIVTPGRFFLYHNDEFGQLDSTSSAYQMGSYEWPFVVFKVQKAHLLEASHGSSGLHSVLAEAGASDATLDGLPYVWLPEEQDVVKAILDSLQRNCLSNILGEDLPSFDGKPWCMTGGPWGTDFDKSSHTSSRCDQYFEWQCVREVWDAAHKYDLHLLGAYAAGVLSLRLPVLRQNYAMEMLNVAKERGDQSLVARIESHLADTKPAWDFTPAELAVIGTQGLLAHWELREERLRSICQRLRKPLSVAPFNRAKGILNLSTLLEVVACFNDMASMLGVQNIHSGENVE